MIYSKSNPSPKYMELLQFYKEMHEDGIAVDSLEPENTFGGQSLIPHAERIKSMIKKMQVTSLLDYGCGKAQGYEQLVATFPDGSKVEGLKNFWGIDDITLFDPGYEPYSAEPGGKFDAVISTDVLEHIPEQDIDWVLLEIFGYSRKCVYCTVALYPAAKIMPNGENAHVTLKSAGWWLDRFEQTSRLFTGRKFHLTAMRENMRGNSEMIIIEG